MHADPRLFQIGSLGMLLAINIALYDIGAGSVQSFVTIAACLLAQWFACEAARVRFDPLSPLISGLSLSLLLRTHEPALWIAAAGLAIGSKFLLRVGGKHLFNPATFAIVVLLGAGAWVSPGQWGTAGWLAGLVLSLGALVLGRARRVDTAAAFIGFYAALLFARAAWFGDPLTIPLHQLQSGSLLLFTCFMITDPRTTPDHPAGRVLFAAVVATLAYHLQFGWQMRAGLFYALAASAPLVPLIDLALRSPRHRWRTLEA